MRQSNMHVDPLSIEEARSKESLAGVQPHLSRPGLTGPSITCSVNPNIALPGA